MEGQRWAHGAHPNGVHPNGAHPKGAHLNDAHPNSAHPNNAHPDGTHPIGAHPNGAHPIGAHPIGAHPIGAHPIGAHPNGVRKTKTILFWVCHFETKFSFISSKTIFCQMFIFLLNPRHPELLLVIYARCSNQDAYMHCWVPVE